MQRCDHCRFFYAHPPAESPDQIVISNDSIRGGGECRCLPPVRAERDPLSRFPVVANDCWCGRFEPAHSGTP